MLYFSLTFLLFIECSTKIFAVVAFATVQEEQDKPRHAIKSFIS